jgi:hypothetical protein
MNTPLNGGNGAGFVEPKKEGYFTMQIGSDLNLFSVGQDSSISRGDVLMEVERISTRVELKPESDRLPLPLSNPTVRKLARWFVENQQSRAAPQKPS